MPPPRSELLPAGRLLRCFGLVPFLLPRPGMRGERDFSSPFVGIFFLEGLRACLVQSSAALNVLGPHGLVVWELPLPAPGPLS